MLSRAVKRRLEEILEAQEAKDVVWPHVSPEIVEHLEGLFPPRCLAPGEPVEDHLRYAGAAELVATMRAHHERQGRPAQLEDLGEYSVEVEVP